MKPVVLTPVVGLLLVVLSAPVTVQAAGVSVPEARDHASTVLGDPWDFSNVEDMMIDEAPGAYGPVFGADGSARYQAGRFVWDASRDSYVSPSYFTIPGALPEGRDGWAVPIDAERFTHASLHIWAGIEHSATASLRWFTCKEFDQTKCMGGDQFLVEPGWNTVMVGELQNDYAEVGLPKPWDGQVFGLRLAFDIPGHYELDWLRVYSPQAGAWTRDEAHNLRWESGSTEGVIKLDHQDATARLSSDALPPGRYQFEAVPGILEVVARPAVQVLDPSVDDGADYATTVLGNPWDFSSPADVVAMDGVEQVAWGRGRMCATNDGNDPHMILPLAPSGLDADRFHNLSFRMTIEGLFDLEDADGGGAHARLLYKTPRNAPTVYTNSREFLTFPSRDLYTYDLGSPPGVPSSIDDDSGRWSFPWAGPITGLRFDPNEDRGARRWCLDEIRISADPEAAEGYRVRWRASTGSSADILARNIRGEEVVLASGIPQRPGVNERAVSVGHLLPGDWDIGVRAHHGELDGTGWSFVPLHVPPRIAGHDRIDTAVRLSRNAFPAGADAAIVATGYAFPDALAAASLADAASGPLLLNDTDDLHPAVAAEIRRLSPDVVYVLGGTAAQSPRVEERLRALTSAPVRRIAGRDRYATAANIAREASRLWGAERGGGVLVATGENFPDALAAGPLAAQANLPLLLARPDAVPPATRTAVDDLDPSGVVAIGGKVAVSDGTLRHLAAGRQTDRIAGADRYHTAAALFEAAGAQGADTGVIGIANGYSFPDALAGAPAVSARGGGLLLTDRGALPRPTADRLRRTLSWVRLLGGPATIAESVEKQVGTLIR